MSPISPRARFTKQQRKAASRKYLLRISLEQKGWCNECGCSLRMDLIGMGHSKTGDVDDRPTIDHIVDLEYGGTNHRDNLRVVCYRCNQNKNDKKNREKNENSYNAR